MKDFLIVLALAVVAFIAATPSKAQDVTNPILISTGAPGNPCPFKKINIDITNNISYFCGGDGNWHSIGAASKVITTPVTASGAVTTDQPLMEVSLPAGYLNNLSEPFLIHGSGIYSTAAAQTPTLTFKAKLCTVSGCGSGTVVTLASITSTATSASVSSLPWNINLVTTPSLAGSSGTLLTHGPLAVDLGTSASVAVTVFNDTNVAASSAIDLTAGLFLDFTVATSTGNASNSITQQIGGVMPWGGSAGGTGNMPTILSTTAGMSILNNGTVASWNPFPSYFVDSLSGADEGAKINACLALLPTGSGSCRMGAGTYPFSTAISLTKTARIEGAGAATDTSGGGSSSTILQWTGTTGVPITLGAGSGGSQLVNFELSDTAGASLAEFVDIESGLDRLNGFSIQNPPKAATTAGIVVGVSGLVSTTTLNNTTIDGAGPWQVEPQNTNLFKITGDSHIIGRGAQGGLLLGTATTDALGTMIGTGVEINSKVGGQDNIQIVRANGLHVEHGTWFEFGNNATTQGYAIDCPATAVKCENIDVAGAEFLGQSLGANNTAANFSGIASATWTFEGNHVSGPFANPGYLINNTASAQITAVGNVLNFTGAAIAASLTNVVRAGNSYANVLGDLVPNYTGTITATHCANWTSSGVLGDAGAACGSGGGPGGLSTQYQINNAGALAGAAALTNSLATGVGTVIASQAGTGGTDIPAERIIGFPTTPTSDKWQVAATGQTPGNTCTILTCVVWINASGNLVFAGNNVQYGSHGQSTQSFADFIGATTNNSFAPPYFEGEKVDGSVKSFFAPSTSQGGQWCGTSTTPVNDCAAGTVFAQNPMTAAGDLVVGGTLVGQIAAPAAPTIALATGGAIAASQTVTVEDTYLNASGETVASGPSSSVTTSSTCPTSGSCSITITTPANSGNAYQFDVFTATGGAYAKVTSGPFALGANQTITALGTGSAPPTSNTTAMYSTPTRLALGTNSQVLTSNGTTVVWGSGGAVTVSSGAADCNFNNGHSFLPVTGGTGNLCSSAIGDVATAYHSAFTVSNFALHISAAFVSGQTISGTIVHNGVDSTVTVSCSATGSAQTCGTDTTHSFTVASGDTLAVDFNGSATVGSGIAAWSFTMTSITP